jgi:FkbM family methyltransferase
MSKYERNLMLKEVKDGTRIYYRENSSDLYAYLENQYKLPDLTREDVMMDVGANMGDIPLRFANRVGKIYSYEPIPETFEILKMNVDVNGYDNCEISNSAISANNGTLTMYLNDAAKCCHVTASMYKRRVKTQIEVTVPAISFSEEVRRIKPTIIKMDIEGAEIDILNNVEDSVFDGVRIFYVELHLDRDKEYGVEWNMRTGDRFTKIFGQGEEQVIRVFNKHVASIWKFQRQ